MHDLIAGQAEVPSEHRTQFGNVRGSFLNLYGDRGLLLS
jgi:hypothetical protein